MQIFLFQRGKNNNFQNWEKTVLFRIIGFFPSSVALFFFIGVTASATRSRWDAVRQTNAGSALVVALRLELRLPILRFGAWLFSSFLYYVIVLEVY